MVRIIVKEVLCMVVVQEEERFWSETEWSNTYCNYYRVLIDSGKITQFKWEVVPDSNYYIVRRSYCDMRPRGFGHDQSDDNERRPKQLPPQMKIDAEVTVEGGTAEEAMEFIQNYRDYWPEGLELNTYAIGQAKGEPPYVMLSFANYNPPEEEEDEEDDDEEYGDIMDDEE